MTGITMMIVLSYDSNNDDYDYEMRVNAPIPNRIGTSSIIHKKNNNKWDSGYAHDWRFVCGLVENNKNFTKIFLYFIK